MFKTPHWGAPTDSFLHREVVYHYICIIEFHQKEEVSIDEKISVFIFFWRLYGYLAYRKGDKFL